MPAPFSEYNASATRYRYGFNGKENDNEVKGQGNQQDYGMRIYDPRLGRFLSSDPLSKSYPMLTPYQFASNRPVDGFDLDGLEYMPFHSSMYKLGYIKEYSSYQTGSGNTLSSVSSRVVVNIIYENIPLSLRDAKSKDFKFVSGGPVGPNGQDLQGPFLSRPGRYFNNGPSFWGLGESSADMQSSYTTGLYHFGMEPDALERNDAQASGLASIGEFPQHAYGLAKNWSNSEIWKGLSEESKAREQFYFATNMVNLNIKEGGFPQNLSLLQKTQLINFMTDGSLFTDAISSKLMTLQGVTNALDIANLGVQALSSLGRLQQKTIQNVNSLIESYKNLGGDMNRYNTLSETIKQSPKKIP